MADIFNSIVGLANGINFEMSTDMVEELEESLSILIINHNYYRTLIACAILDYRNHPNIVDNTPEDETDTYDLILSFLGTNSLAQWLTELVNASDSENFPDAPSITPIYATVEEIVPLAYSSENWVLKEVADFSFEEYDRPENFEFLVPLSEVLEDQLEPFVEELVRNDEGSAYQAMVELSEDLDEFYNYFVQGTNHWGQLDGEDPDDVPLSDILETFPGGSYIQKFITVVDRINAAIYKTNPYFRN